jgi:hypothetical protein
MKRPRRWLFRAGVALGCAALVLWTAQRTLSQLGRASPCGPLASQEQVAAQWRAAHPLPTASSLPSEVVREPKPGAAIEGRVVDVEGKPIADVLVRARSEATPPEDAAVARSDAGGSFRLTGLGSGTYFLRTWADGYRRATREHVPAGSGALVLALTPTLRLVGCVVAKATGRPLERFRVGDEWVEGTGGVFGLTLTDAPGEPLEIRAPGLVPSFVDPTDHGALRRVSHVTRRLRHGIETVGRVIDESGGAVEGAEVSALSRGEGGYRSATVSAMDGRFAFDDLDDRLWLLTARLGGERVRVGTTAVRLERSRKPGEVTIQLGKQGVLVDLLAEDLVSDVSITGAAAIAPEAARVIADSMMEVITARAAAGADPDAHDDLLDAAVERLPPEAITAEVASAIETLRGARDHRPRD